MGLFKNKKGKWSYLFQWRGKLYGGGGFKTRRAAEEARGERRKKEKRLFQLTRGSMALSQAIAQYLAFSERRHMPKTFKYKKYVLEGFYDKIGEAAIDQVTTGQIHSYLATRKSNYNFNRHRKEIYSLFTWIRNTFMPDLPNPCQRIMRMPEPKKAKTIPSQADFLKMIMAAGKNQRPLLLTVFHCLGRVDEVLRLTWPDVNFQHSSIRLWTRKTKDGSMTPDDLAMNEDLKTILWDLWKHRKQDTWVFFNKKTGSRYNRRPKFMPGICKRAKIPNYGFHSLRHFAATLLADDPKIGKKTISGLLRHRNLSTTERYLHTIEEAQRQAIKTLEGKFPISGPDIGSAPKQGETADIGAKTA
jgi:integrase